MILAATLFVVCNSNASNKVIQEAPRIQAKHPSMNHNNHTSVQKAGLEHAIFSVQGLCEICKERIETAAKSVKGVASANWDIKKKKIDVNFDSKLTNLDTISKAITKVGHDTEKFKADSKAYNSLPSCCKYRK